MPLDIGVGILLSLGVAEYFGVEVTPILVLCGIAAALLPDIDIITWPLLGKWYHRTHTHFPLTYIPVAVLAFAFLPVVYATLLTLGVLAHLIHDTVGIGHGIKWCWPFSQRSFLYLQPKEPVPAGRTWVSHYYLRPNLLAYVEYGVLLMSLTVLWLYLI